MQNTSLTINNLDLLVHLGWPEKEREEKQMVRVNIDIHYPTPPKACVSDNLEDTFCYAEFMAKIFEMTKEKQFHLIEHLSQKIYTLLKSIIGLDKKITVHVTKHPAIKDFAGDVCFSYGD